MKIIKVKTCDECPYIDRDEDNGEGNHSSSFITCKKFCIRIYIWSGHENFEYKKGIHPHCGLEEKI